MLKKFIALTGAAVFTMTSLCTVFAANTISVKVNDKEVEFDRPPIVENGRTLIPFRAVLEEMGLYVDWNPNLKAISCTDGEGISVIIRIGDNAIEKITGDGEEESRKSIPLDVPAKIVNGRTLVPIRPIVESFGAEVIWDEKSKTVEIKTEDNLKYSSRFIKAKKEFNMMVLLQTLLVDIANLDDESFEEFKACYIEYFFDYHRVRSEHIEDEDNEKYMEYINDGFMAKLSNIAEKNNISANLIENNYDEYDFNIELRVKADAMNIADKELQKKMYGLLTETAMKFVWADENKVSEFKNLFSKIIDYEFGCFRILDEIRNSQCMVDEINAKYKEFIEEIKDFAEKNGIKIIDREENDKVWAEFTDIIMEINQKIIYKPEECNEWAEEYQNIMTEINEYTKNVVQNPSDAECQEDVDKDTEQYKKYIKRLKDFAEKNGIILEENK